MILWALKIENRDRLTHFWIKKVVIFGKYLYVVHVDEILSRICIFANMRIIRMSRIFPQLHGQLQQELTTKNAQLQKCDSITNLFFNPVMRETVGPMTTTIPSGTTTIGNTGLRITTMISPQSGLFQQDPGAKQKNILNELENASKLFLGVQLNCDKVIIRYLNIHDLKMTFNSGQS